MVSYTLLTLDEVHSIEHDATAQAKKVLLVDSSGDPITENSNHAYETAVDSGDSTIRYFGFAAIGSATSASVWRIFRETNTSGDISLKWADGDDSFDNEWDERENLTYS